MKVKRSWAGYALVTFMAVPLLTLVQQDVLAAGAKKAEWRSDKTSSATTPKKAAPTTNNSAVATTAASEASIPDQSQEVLDIDFAMAAKITAQGPKEGYASALSEEGVLYDANGASPVGPQAAASRFGSFPADVALVRAPESALAAGGSGSSWGTYTIKRGQTVLSAGRYISVWRREVSGWKMISELAAGKTFVAPPAAGVTGVLPKRPTKLTPAAPAPVGMPLTVPTPPATPAPEPSVPNP